MSEYEGKVMKLSDTFFGWRLIGAFPFDSDWSLSRGWLLHSVLLTSGLVLLGVATSENICLADEPLLCTTLWSQRISLTVTLVACLLGTLWRRRELAEAFGELAFQESFLESRGYVYRGRQDALGALHSLVFIGVMLCFTNFSTYYKGPHPFASYFWFGSVWFTIDAYVKQFVAALGYVRNHYRFLNLRLVPRDLPHLVLLHDYSTTAVLLLNSFYGIPVFFVVGSNFLHLTSWSYYAAKELATTSSTVNFFSLAVCSLHLCYQVYSIVRACENYIKEVRIVINL
jgi:hypothetical protein